MHITEDFPLTEYLTEQEQIELLKSWVKQYSLVILAGVLIAALSIFGWRYWQQRQNKTSYHASSVYDEMLTLRAQSDADMTLVQAKKLFTHYHDTPYGQMASLMLASAAINNNNYQEASKRLHWVLMHSKIDSIRQIARLRLARLLIAEQKPKEAIELLKKIEDQNFNGLIYEVRGDAYFAMKDLSLARQSYRQALFELPNAESIRPLLQMKYDNLITNNP